MQTHRKGQMELIGKLWDKIKPHAIWYALILVFILYVLSYTAAHYKFVYWPEMLSQAGATILAAGIFASLLKSYQYSELFKGELENLFADDKFVGKMKNISRHGQDGTQTLRNALEHLATQSSADLGNRVGASFPALLEVRTEYTFRNYKRYIKITGYSKTKGQITIEDEVQYELIVHADTIYKSSAGGIAFAAAPSVNEFTLNEIGGTRVDVSNALQFTPNSMSVEVPVKQGKKYRLHRNLELNYQLFKDPNIHQQISRFCHGFELEIENQVPSDIQFTLSWINFEIEPSADSRTVPGGRTVCRFTEHGLTFPLQGFILTMCPNK